jgi:hypothetical protein
MAFGFIGLRPFGVAYNCRDTWQGLSEIDNNCKEIWKAGFLTLLFILLKMQKGVNWCYNKPAKRCKLLYK